MNPVIVIGAISSLKFPFIRSNVYFYRFLQKKTIAFHTAIRAYTYSRFRLIESTLSLLNKVPQLLEFFEKF